jgi:1-aminocyclopropane-1-carboxylate deaminase/D-cysteine desulfhydrase-like pyridoxal-dependent ACC family enzyme
MNKLLYLHISPSQEEHGTQCSKEIKKVFVIPKQGLSNTLGIYKYILCIEHITKDISSSNRQHMTTQI